jgi:hypothetical protein
MKKPENVKRLWKPSLLAFAVLTAGCATPSPPCVVSLPMPPSPPPLSQPIPSESYLMRAQRNIKMWQQRLNDTLKTSETLTKAGLRQGTGKPPEKGKQNE